MTRVPFFVALALFLMVSTAFAVEQVSDLKDLCASIGKTQYKQSDEDSSSYGRCTFCEYKYHDKSDKAFGGCSSCPVKGECSACLKGYVFFNKQCISCGPNVDSCEITNPNILKDEAIQKIIKDIESQSNRSKKEIREDLMDVYQKYLGLRANSCSVGTAFNSVVDLGKYCLEIPNCFKVKKTDDQVSCLACKAGYYFNENQECISSVADIVTYDAVTNSYSNTNKSDPSKTNTEVCSLCDSQGVCSQCPSGSAENTSEEAKKLQTSPKNKVCQKCLSGCSSCSMNNSVQECNYCTSGFYLDAKVCKKCSISDHLLFKDQQAQLEQYSKIICSGLSFESIQWNFSTYEQEDKLQRKVSTPYRVYNKKAYVCGVGASDCEIINDTLSAKKCISGYIKTEQEGISVCKPCSELVSHSLLCEEHETLKYVPTICEIGSTMQIPYKDMYFMQIILDDYKKSTEQEKYSDTNQWCQSNSNSCKTMVSIIQEGNLYASGKCSTCFEDSDIPEEYRKIPKDFFSIEVGNSKICKKCSDSHPNALSCEISGTDLLATACKDTYYLSSTSTCEECSKSCATCDKKPEFCTKCDAKSYLSSDNLCIALSTLPPKPETGTSNPTEPILEEISECVQSEVIENENKQKQLICKVCSDTHFLLSQNKCSKKDNNCLKQEQEGVCLSCKQDETNYLLVNGVCTKAPENCSNFNTDSCTVCSYGYKLANKVCQSCVQKSGSTSTYDCAGNVKQASDSNDLDQGQVASYGKFLSVVVPVLTFLAFL